MCCLSDVVFLIWFLLVYGFWKCDICGILCVMLSFGNVYSVKCDEIMFGCVLWILLCSVCCVVSIWCVSGFDVGLKFWIVLFVLLVIFGELVMSLCILMFVLGSVLMSE